MKKLLMVVCAAAFGIGAVAQAQIVRTDNAMGKTVYDCRAKMADMSDYSVLGPIQGQLMDVTTPADIRRNDTLGWHDEYVTEECDRYYTLVEYVPDLTCLATYDYMPTPLGAMWSGSGESGATFTTANNLYNTYARIDLNSAWVVGAVAYVYRKGNPTAWNSVDISDYETSEVNGVAVPLLPCKLKGYPTVQPQQTYYDYYDMLEGGEPSLIDVEMPLTMQGAVETPGTYIRYYELGQNGNNPWPTVQRIGGMFDQVFPAWANFGLSVQVELTNNAAYDSLWNWAITAKSNVDMCTFVDDWAAWIRIDYSHPEGFQLMVEEVDVTQPWMGAGDEFAGFAPPACPQYGNGQSLFVYAFSQGLYLKDGQHFLPMLYPIVQNRASIEREQDAYAQTVSVYPVPATDKVNFVALDEIQKVEIYNMAGTLVKVYMMNDIHFELDVTSFMPGTYVAKITTTNGVASKKLLVK